MNESAEDEVVAADCSNVRQGDVVEYPALLFIPEEGGNPELFPTPHGVAVLSQVCDIVSTTKRRCLVAPVIDATPEDLSASRKGRAPMRLYLPSAHGVASAHVANMERSTSVPKRMLVGQRVLSRSTMCDSSPEARQLAARIGRAFVRYPFPDAVYPALRPMRELLQKRVDSGGHFGQVLDLVKELRVSSDQWDTPGRHLTLYLIVDEGLLIPGEDSDSTWSWVPQRVKDMKPGEVFGELVLDRVCALILANRDGDSTTLLRLWARLGEVLQSKYLRPPKDGEVALFDVEVVSESDMTVKQYHATESLDLEALSDSQGTPVENRFVIQVGAS
jgi:hypothetical protein